VAEFDPHANSGRSISSPRARALLAAALVRRAQPVQPRIMGVLNITPDSFSDAGRWNDPVRAVAHGLELLAQGAAVLDVGGESTRPGAAPVDLDEECRRVLPVVRALALKTKAVISVDTTKAALAEQALDLGASLVNDISAGLTDPRMIPLVARRGCDYALMHMQGTPLDMQRAPSYVDVVGEVLAFLRERAGACWRAGLAPERLWVDPGIGFGKRTEHNLELFARLAELRSLGLRLLVGPSRKSFIAQVSAQTAGVPGAQRLGGSAAAVTACVFGGAELLRVHDVAPMLEAANVAWAVHARRAASCD
jgi:dihydropteroate synthase